MVDLLRSLFSRARGRVILLGVAVAAVTAFVIGSAGAVISPSTFEGNDGNMLHQTGFKDWDNVGGVFHDTDPTNSTDDSIGQGSKEDDLFPTVVTQGVPPKNDFADAFIATENVGGKDFLYVSTIRVAPNGSANLNLELNKGTAVPALSPNGVTLSRVAGDKLITFDFTSGGSNATINLLTWILSGSCENSNDVPPCWGQKVALSSSGIAEGAANDGQAGRTGAISSTDNTLSGEALSANRFQEMSVNLTDGGILPPGVCTTFANVTLKSRSSGSSFDSSLKDLLIANRPISNCGTINIHKQDDVGTALQGAEFKLFTDSAPLDGAAPHGAEDLAVSPEKKCTTDASGNCSLTDVPFGQYWVVETVTPPNHNTAADQNVILNSANSTRSLTFVNPRAPGSVSIHKQDDAGNPLAGVRLDLYADVAPLGPPDGNGPNSDSHGAGDTIVTGKFCVTDAGGDCTIATVNPGRYWVVEDPTTVPAGYAAAADGYANIENGGQNVAVTMTDPRLHRVIVIACHEGTNTLFDGSATLDGVTKAHTLTSVPSVLAGKGVTESDLCSAAAGKLGSSGAVFDDLTHGTKNGSVTLPGH